MFKYLPQIAVGIFAGTIVYATYKYIELWEGSKDYIAKAEAEAAKEEKEFNEHIERRNQLMRWCRAEGNTPVMNFTGGFGFACIEKSSVVWEYPIDDLE